MTLREWQIEKGLTHKQLADLLGSTQQNVSKWMGPVTPKLAMMEKIAKLTKYKVQPFDFSPAEKRAGDERLVKKGLCDPSILLRWVDANGK